jgi:hypothetical protein
VPKNQKTGRSKSIMEKPKRKTLDQQIDLALAERDKKEERIKKLRARQRTRDDKARTHRLCRRGGLMEKLHPRFAKLTDDEFDIFVDLVSDRIKSALDEISPLPPDEPKNDDTTAQDGGTAAPKSTETTAKPDTLPTAKPAHTPHNGGTGGNAHHSNRPPQNGNNNAPRPANTQHNNNGGGNGNGDNGERRTS